MPGALKCAHNTPSHTVNSEISSQLVKSDEILQALLMMMMLFIGTHSVTTTLNVHSRSRSFVIAIDLRGLAPSMRLFRRPNTNSMKK